MLLTDGETPVGFVNPLRPETEATNALHCAPTVGVGSPCVQNHPADHVPPCKLTSFGPWRQIGQSREVRSRAVDHEGSQICSRLISDELFDMRPATRTVPRVIEVSASGPAPSARRLLSNKTDSERSHDRKLLVREGLSGAVLSLPHSFVLQSHSFDFSATTRPLKFKMLIVCIDLKMYLLNRRTANTTSNCSTNRMQHQHTQPATGSSTKAVFLRSI